MRSKDELLGEMTRVLNAGFHNAVSEDSCKEALNLAYKMKIIKVTANMVYSTKSFEEGRDCQDIRRIMSASDSKITEIDTFIEEYEDANFKLADSQRERRTRCFLSIRSKSSLADPAWAKQQSQRLFSMSISKCSVEIQCCASGSDRKSRKKNV